MALRVAVLTLSVTYDDKVTDGESLCSAFDTLLDTAMSTPGILDEYGNPNVDPFGLLEDMATVEG